MSDIPHFEYPFRFGADGHVAAVEQDSDEDIVSCTTVILKTPVGDRLDLPAFGVPDQVFRAEGIDSRAFLNALRTWEPRAEQQMTVDDIIDLAQSAVVQPDVRADA